MKTVVFMEDIAWCEMGLKVGFFMLLNFTVCPYVIYIWTGSEVQIDIGKSVPAIFPLFAPVLFATI